jgi:hypothetical protein
MAISVMFSGMTVFYILYICESVVGVSVQMHKRSQTALAFLAGSSVAGLGSETVKVPQF